MSDQFYLTTPLYYVNAKPHIGHAYTEIAADVLARYHRSTGKKVKFLTGTDEHGQKIDRAAKEAGMEPKAFTDKMSATFGDLWKALGIEGYEFIRTTDGAHIQTVQAVWRDLEAKKQIFKGSYSGWYCTPDENFWQESQVLREEGKVLCPDCRRSVEKIEEENYFFRLSAHQDWLMETLRKGDRFRVLPETRKNEVLGFLDNNKLQDLCISRPKNRLSWGIQSPLSESHVTYVWFDALINYITACHYKDGKADASWPADVHLIGKDILRHHAVIWPILLHALGLEPPRLVFAHGWWIVDGAKMSKSLGNVTDPVAVVNAYGVDTFRYFLLREAPFGNDGTFSEEALITRCNADLANGLGNLLSRTLTMCEKYFEGKAPEGNHLAEYLKDAPGDMEKRLESAMNELAFSEALEAIWAVVNRANEYIEKKAPWTLAKQGNKQELALVLYSLVEILRILAKAIAPFMPSTALNMMAQLGTDGKISKGSSLFPRIETK
jgi:methionyl-tRNA synthetase